MGGSGNSVVTKFSGNFQRTIKYILEDSILSGNLERAVNIGLLNIYFKRAVMHA